MLLKTRVYNICVHIRSYVIAACCVLDSLAYLFYRGPWSLAVSPFSYFSRCQYTRVHADTHVDTHTHAAVYLEQRREAALASGVCYLVSLMRLLPDNYTPTAPIAEVCGVSPEFIGQVTSGLHVTYTPHTEGKQPPPLY